MFGARHFEACQPRGRLRALERIAGLAAEDPTESDRARQRGFAWCGQRPDGMSIGNLVASPDLRPLAYDRQAARTRNHSFLYENFRGLNRLGPMIGAGAVGHRPNRRSQVIRESLLDTTLRSLAFGDPVLHRTAERCAAAFSTPATAAQPEVPLCKRAAEVTDAPYRGFVTPDSRAVENLRAALPGDPDDPDRVREIATVIRAAMHGPVSVRQPRSYTELGTAGRGLTNASVAYLEQSRLA